MLRRHPRAPRRKSVRRTTVLTIETMESRESPTDLGGYLMGQWLTVNPGLGADHSTDGASVSFAPGLQEPEPWTRLPVVSAEPDASARDTGSTPLPPPVETPPPPPIPLQPFDGRQFFVALQMDLFADPVVHPLPQEPPAALGGGGGASASEQPTPMIPPEPSGGGGGGGEGGGGGGAATPGTGLDAPAGDSAVRHAASVPAGSGTPATTPDSGSGTSTPTGGNTPTLMTPSQSGPPTLDAKYARSGIVFEQNLGQSSPTVGFIARAGGYVTYLTSTSTVLELARPPSGPALGPLAKRSTPQGRTVDVVAVNFVGANPATRLTGQEELTTRSNYVRPTDPNQPPWAKPLIDIPNFGRVQATNLWTGVDAAYYSSAAGKLEFDFTVNPAASPLTVQLRFQGSSLLSLDLGGNLQIDLPSGGRIVHQKPALYQIINGQRQDVTGGYALLGTDRVGFLPGPYNTAYPLVIDPAVDFSSYLGGSGDDQGLAIAVDGAGNSYLTGSTLSTDFPLQNPFQSSYQAGTEVFVSKLSAAGGALIYSTYVGGSGNEQGNGIAVDLAGNAYVVGTTGSSNFPTTAGAYQTTLGGSTDAFVIQLSDTGDSLHYGSLFGGTVADTGTAIAVDANGQAFFTGDTAGGTFPTTTGAYDTTYNGGTTDAFAAAFNATGTARLYATFVGGAGADTGYGIALDPDGNAYLTGSTDSTAFPTVNAYDSTYNGGTADTFITKVNTTGTGLGYSTYYGGAGEDRGFAIAVNQNSQASVTGRTAGVPTTSGVPQPDPVGGLDGFAAQFSAAGSTLLYATHIGGTADDEGRGIAVVDTDRMIVAGKTASTDFPTANAIYGSNAGGTDAFVTKLYPTAPSFVYSTYLGGSLDDQANGVALDTVGNAYLTGTTQSTDFPTKGPYSSNAGGSDAFLTKINNDALPPTFTGISSDTGSSSTDQITTDQTLILSGTTPVGATLSGLVTVERRNVGIIGTALASPGTGVWALNYTATTLPEGTHAFVATADGSLFTSEFLVTVDLTAPTVTVSMPASTPSKAPQVRVTAQDLNGLPNGTQVRLDVDLNNNGNYTDTGESNYATGTLGDDAALVILPALAGAATYRVRGRVTDLAGNEGTSGNKTFTVGSVTSYSVASAVVRTSDPDAAQDVAAGGCGCGGDTAKPPDALPMLQLGNVHLEHKLDLDKSPGGQQAGNPAMVYWSSSVSVRPVVQATINTPNNAALPSQIGVQLSWNGGAYSTAVNYSTTGLNPGDRITIAAQVASNVTATGRYAWAIKVLVPGQPDLTASGTTFVRVEDASPFGAGWTLSILNKLFDIPADANGPAGKLWLYGTGGFRFFQGTAGTFTSPPEDNGTLVKNGDNTFTYTTPEQVKINFDTSGKETSRVSADGKETMSFSYTGSSLTGLTAIDGGSSTFTYGNPGSLISSIATAGSRTFSFQVSGTDVTQITDPDTYTDAFVYDGTTHRMTRDNRSGVQNQYHYDTYGLADQFTWGTSTSPSVTTVSPALRKGLGALVRNPEDYSGNGYWQIYASATDATSHKTSDQFDPAGRLVVQLAADGGTTTFVRDSAGRISSVTDPIGRQTSYTRDTAGYVTVETLPGSATRQYAYHATYHGITTFTNERNFTTTNTYDAANGHLLTTANTVTDVYGNISTPTTTYAYDATTGLLSTITDPMNRVTTLTYLADGSRRLWKRTDQLGTTELGYDATSGEVSTYKDAKLQTTTTVTDAMGRATSRTDPALHAESWVYDTSALLQQYTNKNNHITKNLFDSYGRGLIEIVQEAQSTTIERTTINRFNADAWTDGVREANSAWMTVTFDPVGRALTTTNALGGMTRSYFDLGGQLLQQRDQVGNATKYQYNSRGWVTQVTDPAGKNWTTTYDNAGNKTQTADPMNMQTTYEYDELNRARKVTDPLLHFTTTVWFGDARVQETKDARGYKTQYSYDFVNKKITNTEAVGTPKQRVTESTIDAVGNVVSIKDPLLHVWTIDYNSLDQPTKYTDPLLHAQTTLTRDNIGNVTASADALNKSTSFTIDALERTTKVTDPLTHSNQAVLDAMNQGVGQINGVGKLNQQVFNALGQNTFNVSPLTSLDKQAFDGAGRLVSITDPVGNKTTFLADARGQMIQETDAAGATISRTFDDAGRLTKVVDRLGRVREFAYFNNNLLQTENWRNTDGGAIVWTRSFTYNENNQVLTAADNNGTYTLTYDELSRVATVQDVWGITLTNTWDAADRLTQVTDTKGGTRNYDYDNANRNTVRKLSATGQAARLDIGYNDRNEATSLSRYSDLAGTTLVGKTIFTIDDAHRVTNINHQNGALTTIDSYGYQYDNADRVTQETSTLGPTRNYTYDVSSQLTGDGTSTWTFDLAGNRTNTGYQTGTANRLSTDGTWNYTYDSEGNLTKRVNISSGETWNFSFNQLNQLTRVEKHSSDGGPLTMSNDFKYDVFGNRIEKDYDDDGDGPHAAAVTHYAYEGPNAWADLDSLNNLQTRRLYLDGVDALFARIGSSGNPEWYLTDRLGSIRDLMNNSGTILDHIDYGGFGQVTNETSPSNGDRYKFTAREFDSELPSLGYYRARYYQVDVGRWTSEDPIRFRTRDSDLYRYVGNNATNAVDPSGLDVIYLYDKDAYNPALSVIDPQLGIYGHGAVLVGSDRPGEGWNYYSFSTGQSYLTTADNLTTMQFATLQQAMMARYRYDWEAYIRWRTSAEMDARARQEAERWRDRTWLPIRNCDNLSASVIQAAGIQFICVTRPVGAGPAGGILSQIPGGLCIAALPVSLPNLTFPVNAGGIIASQVGSGATGSLSVIVPVCAVQAGNFPGRR